MSGPGPEVCGGTRDTTSDGQERQAPKRLRRNGNKFTRPGIKKSKN